MSTSAFDTQLSESIDAPRYNRLSVDWPACHLSLHSPARRRFWRQILRCLPCVRERYAVFWSSRVCHSKRVVIAAVFLAETLKRGINIFGLYRVHDCMRAKVTVIHLERDPEMIWTQQDNLDAIGLRFDEGDAGAIQLTRERTAELIEKLQYAQKKMGWGVR